MATSNFLSGPNPSAAQVKWSTAEDIGATSLAPLDAGKLVVSRTRNLSPVPTTASQTSKKTHTDHLLTVSWSCENGWGVPEIVPYRPLSIEPTASVLHYATSCFEGCK